MSLAIDTFGPLDSFASNAEYGQIGALGNRAITIHFESQTEALFTYLQEINQDTDTFYDFSAVSLIDQVEMLEKTIELQSSSESLHSDPTAKDALISSSHLKLFSLMEEKDDQNSFLPGQFSSSGCSKNQSIYGSKPPSQDQLPEFLAQKNLLSIISCSKKSMALFFALAANVKTGKIPDFRKTEPNRIPLSSLLFPSTKEGCSFKKQDTPRKVESHNASLTSFSSPSTKEVEQKKEDADQKRQNRDGQDSEEREEQEEKQRPSKKIKVIRIDATTSAGSSHQDTGNVHHRYSFVTGVIEGIALSLCITKLSLRSEQLSIAGTKEKIEAIDGESSDIRKARLKTLAEANKKEKACKKWSIMTKVMSWLISATTLVAGLALMATGAGVGAGALLFFGGFLSITNQLLEITGGWNYFASKLDTESAKSRSIIMWIQVTITSLSIVLAGAGAIFGGISAMKEAFTTAQMLFAGIANAGVGTLMISIAIINKDFYQKQAKIKSYEKDQELLKHERSDLFEIFEKHAEETEDIYSSYIRMMKMHHQAILQIIHLIKR